MIRLATGARAAFLGGVASLAMRLSAGAQTAPVPAGAQEFATRTDIVLADVTAVDGKGQPVRDLAIADFTLSVNGRARTIQAVEYVASSGRRSSTGTSAETRSASSDARDGRLLLIAADEAHLSFGAGRAVLRAAENLIDRLAPEDRVGVVRLPTGGGVEFTQDHARAIEGLRGVNGRATRPTRLVATVYPSEAVDLLENGGHSEWQTALIRECSSAASSEQCRDAMVMESQTLIAEMRTDATATFRALEQLLRNLQPLKAPIHMVLISEGLFVSRNSESMASLASLAASARVSMNIVRPAKDWYDASSPGISSNRNADDQLFRGGLEQLAGEMRGGFYTAIGDGSVIFDRIGAELSGYYLLAFEPTIEDRTGRERRIKIEVKRRGVTLRSRSTFVMPSPAAAVARATEPPAAAPAPAATPGPATSPLSAPPSVNALPVRLVTYSMFNADDGRVRVLIAAEAGDSVSEPSSWRASLILKDARGQIVSNSAATVSLSPARPAAPSPALFSTEIALSPGDYSLTLALVSADGRAGIAEQKLVAQFRSAPGGFSVSDLVVVSEPEAGASMRLTPTALVDRDRAMVFLEVHHADSTALDAVRATFEVAQSESGPAIVTTTATSDARANGTQRAFAGSLLLNALPPGDYVVRSTLTDAGGTRSQFARSFRLDRRRSTSSANATGAGSPAMPLMRAGAALPAFSLQAVLAPAVVGVFVADLEQRHPSSAATKTFHAGLSELQAGRSTQASELFRQTLRAAPDFVGVAFYLGSCYAAIGKDREAIGAWQMSLLSKGSEAVYPMLVDALLRVGENKKALDLLAEAPTAWPNPSERMRREAVARAAIGEDELALSMLGKLIANPPADRGLLFVGIQVTYRLYASRGLTKEERERFADWTRQYESLGGEESALVRTWRDHVGR
jgi:VWFA-related protein